MKVLIADDDHSIRFILKVQLESWGHQVISCKDGKEALQHLTSDDPPRIAILDWVMDGYTGVDISNILKNRTPLIYIILFTSKNNEKDLVEAIEKGAHCFQSKPVSPGVLKSHIEVAKRLITAEDKLKTQEREIRLQCYSALSDLAEVRHNNTGFHMKRISLYTKLMAEKLGMTQKQSNELALYSKFHDIGKVGIVDTVLLSKEAYNKNERDVMNTHTEIGYSILSSVPTLRTAALIARSHHELWNGTGYPDKLKEDEIPLEARIVAIVDVYDALRSERTYKKSWTHPEVVRYMRENAGKAFDPKLVDIFLLHEEEFNQIFNTNSVNNQ
ncbi:MAG: response regulator [Spirochaetales bacterium]|nr:response regulator [Spirochaetales bacterium]